MKSKIWLSLAIVLVFGFVGAAWGGVSYPKELGAIVDQYPGSSVMFSNKNGEEIAAGLLSNDDPDKIMAYYKKALTGQGWDAANEMAMNQMSAAQFEKGDKQFIVTVSDQGGQRLISLVWSNQ